MELNLIKADPLLRKYSGDLQLRMDNLLRTKEKLLQPGQTLSDFANGHLYFGFHRTDDGWFYRDWAPGAEKMYLRGDFNRWDPLSCPMTRLDHGVFELFLPGRDALKH